jgi:hypothetical protein
MVASAQRELEASPFLFQAAGEESAEVLER